MLGFPINTTNNEQQVPLPYLSQSDYHHIAGNSTPRSLGQEEYDSVNFDRLYYPTAGVEFQGLLDVGPGIDQELIKLVFSGDPNPVSVGRRLADYLYSRVGPEEVVPASHRAVGALAAFFLTGNQVGATLEDAYNQASAGIPRQNVQVLFDTAISSANERLSRIQLEEFGAEPDSPNHPTRYDADGVLLSQFFFSLDQDPNEVQEVDFPIHFGNDTVLLIQSLFPEGIKGLRNRDILTVIEQSLAALEDAASSDPNINLTPREEKIYAIFRNESLVPTQVQVGIVTEQLNTAVEAISPVLQIARHGEGSFDQEFANINELATLNASGAEA